MKPSNKRQTRPLVLVTGPNKRFKFAWWATRLQLWRAKARAVYLSPGDTIEPSFADAVIIGGGNDINPKHYGLTGAAGAVYDEARDDLELSVIRHALKNKTPILGICRGEQLINVALGGTLIGDLRPLRVKTPNRNSLFPIKRALLEPGTRLSTIFENTSTSINSLHNQAVDRLADGLLASAHDEDGFVQAIEGRSPDHWLLGVQWHPEYLLFESAQLNLFKALVRAAKNNQSH